jgi:hypothetical protein
LLKGIAISLFFISVIPIIIYGDFSNEFLRITILMSAIAFTFYADLHWLIRIVGVVVHIFIIQFLEAYYLREYLL